MALEYLIVCRSFDTSLHPNKRIDNGDYTIFYISHNNYNGGNETCYGSKKLYSIQLVVCIELQLLSASPTIGATNDR
jgi:hypothetical protein